MPAAAILALFCAPSLLSAPSAAATKLTVATGSITCRKLTGAITFKPPVHWRLSQAETSVISVHASACTTSNSNVAHVSGGNLTFTSQGTSGGCSGLEEGKTLTGIERWQPSSIAPSSVVMEGFTRRANGASGLVYSNAPGRQQVIVLPAPGKEVSVTGSFAGKASYVAQEDQQGSILAYTDLITGQPVAKCKSPGGLSVMYIVSGVEALP